MHAEPQQRRALGTSESHCLLLQAAKLRLAHVRLQPDAKALSCSAGEVENEQNEFITSFRFPGTPALTVPNPHHLPAHNGGRSIAAATTAREGLQQHRARPAGLVGLGASSPADRKPLQRESLLQPELVTAALTQQKGEKRKGKAGVEREL